MNRYTGLIFGLIFSANGVLAADVTCIGSYAGLGNLKVELNAKTAELFVQKESGFVSLSVYSYERGQGMLGNSRFTHIFKDSAGDERVDFQLNIYPAIAGAHYEPLTFFKAPYFHSDLLYRMPSKAVTIAQLYDDKAVIESYSNLVCKQN